MLQFHQSVMPIQITGPADAVNAMLEQHEIQGAKWFECHSHIWIEAPMISQDLEAKVERAGCKVHHRDENALR